jgi:hypothetical protein
MKSVEFKTIVHNGMIEIPKENPEIKNREVKVIIMWEEKPLDESKELQKIYKVIDEGADISSFGDVEEWQRITRADRNINSEGL